MPNNTDDAHSPRKPHPVDVSAGHQLRLARLRRQLTQAELGSAVGVTFQQIQKYERGTNRMSLSRAAEFARVLGIKPWEFFADIAGVPDNIPDRKLSRWLALLAQAQKAAKETHLIEITQAVVRSWNNADTCEL